MGFVHIYPHSHGCNCSGSSIFLHTHISKEIRPIWELSHSQTRTWDVQIWRKTYIFWINYIRILVVQGCMTKVLGLMLIIDTSCKIQLIRSRFVDKATFKFISAAYCIWYSCPVMASSLLLPSPNLFQIDPFVFLFYNKYGF